MGALQHIGNIENKEYYLDFRETVRDSDGTVFPNPTYRELVWRVPSIRESFRAQREHRILSADYSQIEVKLMGFLSQDTVLIDGINSGRDIHCYTATRVFGKRFEFDLDLIDLARKNPNHPRYNELSSLRGKVKTVTFGVPYGAQAPKVAAMTGMSIEEAQAFIDEFFATMFKLKEWLDIQGNRAILEGFTTTPRGRKRFYRIPSEENSEADNILSQIRRWAGNQPIQSSNVDMLKPAMKLIYDGLRLLDIPPEMARMLFVVHDEIVMTSHISLVPQVKALMQTSMTKSYDDIIKGIINEITVVEDEIWAKA